MSYKNLSDESLQKYYSSMKEELMSIRQSNSELSIPVCKINAKDYTLKEMMKRQQQVNATKKHTNRFRFQHNFIDIQDERVCKQFIEIQPTFRDNAMSARTPRALQATKFIDFVTTPEEGNSVKCIYFNPNFQPNVSELVFKDLNSSKNTKTQTESSFISSNVNAKQEKSNGTQQSALETKKDEGKSSNVGAPEIASNLPKKISEQITNLTNVIREGSELIDRKSANIPCTWSRYFRSTEAGSEYENSVAKDNRNELKLLASTSQQNMTGSPSKQKINLEQNVAIFSCSNNSKAVKCSSAPVLITKSQRSVQKIRKNKKMDKSAMPAGAEKKDICQKSCQVKDQPICEPNAQVLQAGADVAKPFKSCLTCAEAVKMISALRNEESVTLFEQTHSLHSSDISCTRGSLKLHNAHAKPRTKLYIHSIIKQKQKMQKCYEKVNAWLKSNPSPGKNHQPSKNQQE